MYNVGKVKYLVSFSAGTKTHKDGSEFFDIATFKNKVKMNEFINMLETTKVNPYEKLNP